MKQDNLKKRWTNEENHVDFWAYRTLKLANWITKNSKVLEVGCGKKALLKKLPNNVEYFPTDAYPLEKETFILNFNDPIESWKLPIDEKFDYIIFSGVIEYLENPLSVLRFLREKTEFILCSYLHKEECGLLEIAKREEADFKNHYTIGEFADLFREAGFERAETNYWHGHRLYKFV